MATIAQVPQDRPFVVGLASTFTTYPTYREAQTAALALSVANANATTYTAQVIYQVTNAAATGMPPGGRVDMVPGTPGAWIVQLSSTTTYLPEATALSQAFTTSSSNSNAATYVARTFQSVKGP